MINHFAHLVGSVPYKNEKTAMTKTIKILGKNLRSLPDGEIGRKTERHKAGERLGWIQWVIERFEDNPAFKIAKRPRYSAVTGLWADYKSVVRYALNVKPGELPGYLDFGYIPYFKDNYSLFKKLRGEYRNPKLTYQFGIPGALAISIFSLGLIRGIRTRKIFEDRLALEVNAIHEIGKDDLLLQIEVPIELGLVIKAPGFLRPFLNRWAVGNIISLVEKLDPSMKIGIHLCLGDLNNRPFSRIRNATPLVNFSNEIVRRWPRGRSLDFIHFPLAMANLAPSMNAAFYAPLKKLVLPPDTRFIAGFVHEKLNDYQLRDLLELVENMVGRKIDVSSSCGLGRRSEEVTDLLLKKMANLVHYANRASIH